MAMDWSHTTHRNPARLPGTEKFIELCWSMWQRKPSKRLLVEVVAWSVYEVLVVNRIIFPTVYRYHSTEVET